MAKRSPDVDLLLITLALAGGRVRGKTRLQKLAYLVWKRLYEESLKRELPRDLARLLSVRPRPGPYGGVIAELQDEAPRKASGLGLIEWLRPVGAPDGFELTPEGWRAAQETLARIRALGIELDGEIRELAGLPLNELLLVVYRESLPEHLAMSRLRDRMNAGSLVAYGDPSPETLSLIEDLEREGLVERDEKYMRIGECEELEPGLTLCVKKTRKGRPVFEFKVDPRLFEARGKK